MTQFALHLAEEHQIQAKVSHIFTLMLFQAGMTFFLFCDREGEVEQNDSLRHHYLKKEVMEVNDA